MARDRSGFADAAASLLGPAERLVVALGALLAAACVLIVALPITLVVGLALGVRNAFGAARASAPAIPLDPGAIPGPELRILVLTPRPPRVDADGSWTLYHRLRALARHHSITLFTLADNDEEAAAAEPLRAFCERVVVQRRVDVTRVADPHHRVPPTLALEFSAPGMRGAVARVLTAARFDIVQVEYVEMAHLAHDLVRDLPAVYTCHETASSGERRRRSEARGTFQSVWAWFRHAQALDHDLRLARAFRHVVFLSETERRALAVHLPDRAMSTIPSGLEVGASRPIDAAASGPVITFVGFFGHPPNVEAARWLVERVLPEVRRDVPAVELRLVGRDPTPEVRALGMHENVRVTGFVADLQGELARAAVVAAPIRTGGGLRGKVLEAWAAGKALVATSTALEGLAAEDGREVLIADDAVGFAARLVRCLRDPRLRARLGAAGRALVEERYSVAASTAAFERLYATITREVQDA